MFCNPELSDQATKSLSPSRKSHTTRSIECKRNWAAEARKPNDQRDSFRTLHPTAVREDEVSRWDVHKELSTF